MKCPRDKNKLIDFGDSHVAPDKIKYYHCLHCRHSYGLNKKTKVLTDLGKEAV